jgi:GNAT superfamily N-acetyltransferase
MTDVTLRPAAEADCDECARICFEAFGEFHDHHRFPRDFPTPESAAGMMAMMCGNPSFFGVVAEREGRIVGSNFLDERDPIRGVGPITVDPSGQNAGVGRRLMEAVVDRGRDAPGIRLLQDGFHMRSLSLYRSLGFEVKEPVAVTTGSPVSSPVAGVEVRPVQEADLDRCAALCRDVHGFERTGALRDALRAFTPWLAERDGRTTAYATASNFWPLAHGVAETPDDMKALLVGAAAATGEPISFLLPIRDAELFGWALSEGLRLLKPMNLMAIGEYVEPRGSWFPSVVY